MSDKFTINLNLNTKKAEKGLEQFKKKIKQYSDINLSAKPLKLNVDDTKIRKTFSSLNKSIDILSNKMKGMSIGGAGGKSRESQSERVNKSFAQNIVSKKFNLGKFLGITVLIGAIKMLSKSFSSFSNDMAKRQNMAGANFTSPQQMSGLEMLFERKGFGKSLADGLVKSVTSSILSGTFMDKQTLFAYARLTNKSPELLSPKDIDPFEFIRAIKEGMDKGTMTGKQEAFWMSKIGINREQWQALTQLNTQDLSEDTLKKLARFGGVTQENIEEGKKLKNSFATLSQNIKGSSNDLLNYFSPAVRTLAEIINGIVSIVRASGNFIKKPFDIAASYIEKGTAKSMDYITSSDFSPSFADRMGVPAYLGNSNAINQAISNNSSTTNNNASITVDNIDMRGMNDTDSFVNSLTRYQNMNYLGGQNV